MSTCNTSALMTGTKSHSGTFITGKLLGDHIERAGQDTGEDPQTLVVPREVNAQIDQGLTIVDLNLDMNDAGGNGPEQVSQATPDRVPMDDQALGAMVQNTEK
ncbi:YjgF/Yer057p/UK114 family [Penicillium sp. DV-2018c]|nr:YjgF/Yer057p/UK114 family [Penicillium sp. DV-2018c]